MRRVLLVIWYFINALTPITLEFLEFVILVFALSNGRECKCKTAKVHSDRHIKGAKVLGNKSSREQKFHELSFPGAKRPGIERARERIGQGARRPGSESSRERIGQSPIGRFAQGSELARYPYKVHRSRRMREKAAANLST